MGYRSDVSFLFYTHKVVGENNWPALKLYIDENFPETMKGGLEFLESNTRVGYLWEEKSVKWYDSYPEVAAFNRFVQNYLELADGDDLPWAYESVIIGEDYEDIQTTYSDKSDYALDVVRSIEIHF